MTKTAEKINTEKRSGIAPLKNVVSFATLVQNLQEQDKDMPPRFGVYYGFAGYGKSQAGIFAQIRLNCVKVDVDPLWPIGELLRAILKELGENPGKKDARAEMSNLIKRRLSEPSAPTLIIDEADFLLPAKVSSGAGQRSMIEVVRNILEGAARSIILIGEEDFPKKLRQYDRCYDRVLEFVPARAMDAEDAQKMLRACYPGLQLDQALIEHVLTVSRGVARRVDVNFKTLLTYAKTVGTYSLTLESYTGAFNDGSPPARSPRGVQIGGAQ